jgi:hypothetical protein
MKTRVLLLTVMLVAPAALAQRKPERPRIHAEFYPGSLPVSREFTNIVAKEDVRLILVGLHERWDLEKISKETKLGIDDVSRVFADLEEQRLAFMREEFDLIPLIPVIREQELEKLKTEEKLRAHSQELLKVFEAGWPEIEKTAASLEGAKGVPKEAMAYQIVAGGLLYGSMLDAFFEDQTLMVPPPRRAGSQRYYGWLIEGNARLAGLLRREQWESEGYYLVSVGPAIPQNRTPLGEVRAGNGMILDEAESRRYRSFLSVFARDRLLPFFKTRRSDIFAAIRQFEAGSYGARNTDIFSWYYDQLVNGVVEELVKQGKIKAPDGHYTYAVRTLTR